MEDHKLTDAEKNEIAELAAQKAYEKFYQSVGQSVVKKAMWVIGAGVAFAYLWLKSEGHVK